MSFRFLFPFVATLVLLLSAPSARAESTPEDLFRQGRQAVQKKDWQRARDLLARSWALKKSFDTAALLGQSELKLEKFRDAAEHLDFAVRNFPNLEPSADARKRIEEAAKRARSKVLALRISASVPGAEITVDGSSVGREPLDAEVFLEPGKHQVKAALDGYDAADREVEAKPGHAEHIELKLDKQPTAPEASAPAAASPSGPTVGAAGDRPTTAPSGSGAKTATLVTGAALTAVSLGIGIGFGLDSTSAAGDADDLSAKLGANGCSNGANATACADLKDTRDRANRSATIATVGFVGAGVLGAATAAIWLAWPDEKPGTTRLHLAPMLGATRGFAVRAQF